MPKQTPNYALGMFQPGEFLDSTTENNRFQTIDSLLGALYSIVGNGVVEGWELSSTSGLAVDITPGQGVIAKIATQSVSTFTLPSLTPNSTNYIYATLIPSSTWDGGVTFSSMATNTQVSDAVLLGSATTNGTSVIAIDGSLRSDVGLI